LKISMNVLQTMPRPLIDFPLYDGKINILSDAQISVNIKLESIVLKILHIFKPDIPEEILLDKEIGLPMLPYNATMEQVTVEAGTYDAYNIKFLEGLFGSIYYAPAVGNIIKAEANMEIPDQLLVDFHGELKETNY